LKATVLTMDILGGEPLLSIVSKSSPSSHGVLGYVGEVTGIVFCLLYSVNVPVL